MNSRQFPYVLRDPSLGNWGMAAMLPLTLSGPSTISVHAMVDSGASINVLPFDLGVQLGFEWHLERQFLTLSGNLAKEQSKAVFVQATVESFPPFRLALAWIQSNSVPLILGQVNFFQQFDVCFFRNRQLFEVRPKS